MSLSHRGNLNTRSTWLPVRTPSRKNHCYSVHRLSNAFHACPLHEFMSSRFYTSSRYVRVLGRRAVRIPTRCPESPSKVILEITLAVCNYTLLGRVYDRLCAETHSRFLQQACYPLPGIQAISPLAFFSFVYQRRMDATKTVVDQRGNNYRQLNASSSYSFPRFTMFFISFSLLFVSLVFFFRLRADETARWFSLRSVR